MNFVTYVIVGLIAGWVATELSSKSDRRGFLSNAMIGTAGALVGGYIFEILGLSQFSFWESVGTAMVGATIILYLIRFLTRSKKSLNTLS